MAARPQRRDRRIVLLAVLALAAAVRFAVWLAYPSIHWPDEIIQSIEPAHRLVFGYGIQSWEWHLGIRSWFLPGLIAVPLQFAAWADLGPAAYLPAVHLPLALLSLTVVFVAFRLGEREAGGRSPLLIAALAAAPAIVWFELIYFAPRALTEVVAAHLMISGLYLLQTHAGDRRRLVWAGLLLGLAAMTRPHIAPGIAVGSLLALGWPGRHWPPFLAAAGIAMLALGLLDWLTWEAPFQSLWLHFKINLVDGNFARWSDRPWNYLLSDMIRHWGGALAVLLLLIALGARGHAPLLGTAITIIALHSALSHKEFRYIYPAVACLVVLAGLGLARTVRLVAGAAAPPGTLAGAARVGGLAVALTSAALAVQPGFSDEWVRGAATIRAYRAMSQRADVCGVALLDYPLAAAPGHSHLHRRAPFFEATAELGATAAAVNYVVTPADILRDAPEFSLLACWEAPGAALAPDRTCLWRRDGGCAPPAQPGWGVP